MLYIRKDINGNYEYFMPTKSMGLRYCNLGTKILYWAGLLEFVSMKDTGSYYFKMLFKWRKWNPLMLVLMLFSFVVIFAGAVYESVVGVINTFKGDYEDSLMCTNFKDKLVKNPLYITPQLSITRKSVDTIYEHRVRMLMEDEITPDDKKCSSVEKEIDVFFYPPDMDSFCIKVPIIVSTDGLLVDEYKDKFYDEVCDALKQRGIDIDYGLV